jgi:hypothetical protein
MKFLLVGFFMAGLIWEKTGPHPSWTYLLAGSASMIAAMYIERRLESLH